jgi:hypothetical protein
MAEMTSFRQIRTSGFLTPDPLKFKADADACADLFNAKLANCRGGRVARRAKMASGKTPYNSRKTATPLRPTRPPLQRDCDKVEACQPRSEPDWQAARRLTSEAADAKSNG